MRFFQSARFKLNKMEKKQFTLWLWLISGITGLLVCAATREAGFLPWLIKESLWDLWRLLLAMALFFVVYKLFRLITKKLKGLFMDSGKNYHGEFPEERFREILRSLDSRARAEEKFRHYFNSPEEGLKYAKALATLEKGDVIYVPGPENSGWLKAVYLGLMPTPAMTCVIFIAYVPENKCLGTGTVPLAFVRMEEPEHE